MMFAIAVRHTLHLLGAESLDQGLEAPRFQHPLVRLTCLQKWAFAPRYLLPFLYENGVVRTDPP